MKDSYKQRRATKHATERAARKQVHREHEEQIAMEMMRHSNPDVRKEGEVRLHRGDIALCHHEAAHAVAAWIQGTEILSMTMIDDYSNPKHNAMTYTMPRELRNLVEEWQ